MCSNITCPIINSFHSLSYLPIVIYISLFILSIHLIPSIIYLLSIIIIILILLSTDSTIHNHSDSLSSISYNYNPTISIINSFLPISF